MSKTRKFDGKTFKKVASFVAIYQAEKIRSAKKKKGYYVRIVPRHTGRGPFDDTDYDVYVRKK